MLNAECGCDLLSFDHEVEVYEKDAANETLAQKGASGRAFYEENFMKEKCLRNLDEIVGC